MEDIEGIEIDLLETSDTENEDEHSGDETEKEEVKGVYKESAWPAKPEEPKGFTFKGKSKMMGYITEKAKNALKKGSDNEIGTIKFKVLDSKKIGGPTQITVEVADNEGRGISIVDFWGPNKRKECTVMIKKTKDHEERYVKILAKQIIQPILDCLISGRGLEKLFKEQKKNVNIVSLQIMTK